MYTIHLAFHMQKKKKKQICWEEFLLPSASLAYSLFTPIPENSTTEWCRSEEDHEGKLGNNSHYSERVTLCVCILACLNIALF